jgi:cytochrome P450
MNFLLNKRKVDSEEERHDLLSLMIRSEGLTEQEIKANAFIFFIAGHETTATTLTWALYR